MEPTSDLIDMDIRAPEPLIKVHQGEPEVLTVPEMQSERRVSVESETSVPENKSLTAIKHDELAVHNTPEVEVKLEKPSIERDPAVSESEPLTAVLQDERTAHTEVEEPQEKTVVEMDTAVPESIPYLCTECGLTFSLSKQLKKHLFGHIAEMTGTRKKEKSTCDKCPGRTFLDIKLHERHHQMGLECDVCGEAFSAAITLAEHRMCAHTAEKPFTCTICSKGFVTEAEMNRHFVRHTKADKSKRYSCKTQRKQFSSEAHAASHNRSHTVEKSFPCPHCKHASTSKDLLRVHMRTHSGEMSFACSLCGKGFATSSSLNNHVQAVHEEVKEKLFPCSVCKKEFRKLHDLKLHVLTHIDQRPHKCDECGASFTQKQFLEEHTLRHREERPFKCMECAYSSASKSCLLKHMEKYHVGNIYECAECKKLFSKKDGLIAHIEKDHQNALRNEEKSYERSDSGRKFTAASNHNKHGISHAAAKSYHCKYCGKVFMKKDILKDHMKKKHLSSK